MDRREKVVTKQLYQSKWSKGFDNMHKMPYLKQCSNEKVLVLTQNASVAEWSIATGCKPVALAAT